MPLMQWDCLSNISPPSPSVSPGYAGTFYLYEIGINAASKECDAGYTDLAAIGQAA